MPTHRPPTTRQVLARLARLRPSIERTEARLAALYTQRVETFQAGRAVDPRTTKPRATFPAMAEAAGVSEEAIHKALRMARRRDAEQPAPAP
jgi:hypothetical protein